MTDDIYDDINGIYYDKAGQRISMKEWGKLRWNLDEGGRVSDYARIGFDKVGEAEVSTVWLGMDHSFTAGPPVIFETMIFDKTADWDQHCVRYHTEEQAREGHRRTVEDLTAGREPWWWQE